LVQPKSASGQAFGSKSAQQRQKSALKEAEKKNEDVDSVVQYYQRRTAQLDAAMAKYAGSSKADEQVLLVSDASNNTEQPIQVGGMEQPIQVGGMEQPIQVGSTQKQDLQQPEKIIIDAEDEEQTGKRTDVNLDGAKYSIGMPVYYVSGRGLPVYRMIIDSMERGSDDVIYYGARFIHDNTKRMTIHDGTKSVHISYTAALGQTFSKKGSFECDFIKLDVGDQFYHVDMIGIVTHMQVKSVQDYKDKTNRRLWASVVGEENTEGVGLANILASCDYIYRTLEDAELYAKFVV